MDIERMKDAELCNFGVTGRPLDVAILREALDGRMYWIILFLRSEHPDDPGGHPPHGLALEFGCVKTFHDGRVQHDTVVALVFPKTMTSHDVEAAMGVVGGCLADLGSGEEDVVIASTRSFVLLGNALSAIAGDRVGELTAN